MFTGVGTDLASPLHAPARNVRIASGKHVNDMRANQCGHTEKRKMFVVTRKFLPSVFPNVLAVFYFPKITQRKCYFAPPTPHVQ